MDKKFSKTKKNTNFEISPTRGFCNDTNTSLNRLLQRLNFKHAQTIHEIDAESHYEFNQYIYILIRPTIKTIFMLMHVNLHMKMTRAWLSNTCQNSFMLWIFSKCNIYTWNRCRISWRIQAIHLYWNQSTQLKDIHKKRPSPTRENHLNITVQLIPKFTTSTALLQMHRLYMK